MSEGATAAAPGRWTGLVALVALGVFLLADLPVILDLADRVAGSAGATVSALIRLAGNAAGLPLIQDFLRLGTQPCGGRRASRSQERRGGSGMVDGSDDGRLADLLLDEVEQRRRGWLLVILGVLVSALAVAVPVLLSTGPSVGAGGPTHAGAGAGTRAAVYVAALSGGPVPHRLTHRVFVRDRECADVVSMPVSRCHGPTVPIDVQERVRTALGPAVVFRANPPSATRTQVPVVSFGPLTVTGSGVARLQMETLCGALCGQGQTLVLRRHDGHWQVSGTTGPQWAG